MKQQRFLKILLPLLILFGAVACSKQNGTKPEGLLNVSYDPTRELYQEFNSTFKEYWKQETGESISISMSHGGSGSQARAVIEGLEADVVTLALAWDIDALATQAKLLPMDWQGSLPNNNAPYTSTLAFLVRKGNPKGIYDWSDLAKAGVQVITPNPKTSGVARWNYLAMWGYALREHLGSDFARLVRDEPDSSRVQQAQEAAFLFVSRIFHNVPVLDSGARAATNTFIQRGIGDVLINWENEILLGGKELDQPGLEIITPPVSILAEPTVAIVSANTQKHGTEALAKAYLEFLYSKEGQEIAARNFYRPYDQEVMREYQQQFPSLELFTIDTVFGGWNSATAIHFSDGGNFDRIFQKP